MAIKLGMDAKLYIGGTEVENCRDLTMNLETATADVTTRGNDGWRATVATLKDATIEFEMVADDTDSSFDAVSSAFINNTNLEVACMDGGGAYGEGIGLQAVCMVTSFSRNEALEEAITYSVTLQPTYAPGNPPEWISGA